MQNILKNTTDDDSTVAPWILLLMICGYVITALFIFNFLSFIVIGAIFGYDLQELINILSNPNASEDARLPLMLTQGITSLGAFVLAPVIFIKLHLKLSLRPFFAAPEQLIRPVFLTIVILFCFMVANSVVIEWNQNINMPGIFSSFEEWAQSKELQLEELTEYLTSFNGIEEYLIAMLVIAVLPAIGEELLFRGLIQNLFRKALGNHHLAIWAAAVLFGVMHFQFYGVVPRIFLGALFGYIYYWSGHLSLAMIGHFVNNGLTLTLLYFTQLEFTDFDPTSTENSPPFYVVSIFFVAGAVLLYLFRNYFSETKNA
ncbi:MAG: CPBP family intramembrane glutamic endopeptidase [Marinoscillum sp.]